MNILEGRDPNHGILGRMVPPPIRTMSPAQPIRSMLDIGDDPIPRSQSIAGPIVTSPLRSAPLTSSMLSPKGSPRLGSVSSSSDRQSQRSRSDGSGILPSRPRSGSDQDVPFNRDQFQSTSSSGTSASAIPRRMGQGSKKMGSMATVVQGQELDPLFPGGMRRDQGRHNSTAGIMGSHHNKSKSPSSRLGKRSYSPATSMLNTNSFNLLGDPGKYHSESGKIIDLNSAWRKLSDAHLLKTGSSLSATPANDHRARARLNSGEVLSPSGEYRMAKDYDEDAVESSDDEAKTSDEEAWGSRGRRRDRPDGSQHSSSSDAAPKAARSLLAAAEEERVQISSKYKVKSLLDPDDTTPVAEKNKRLAVHPNTAFNALTSRSRSPAASELEELDDIKRAQQLEIHVSTLDTLISHRVLRTIVRGDFSEMQREAEEGKRRVRTYIVATDLSAEAAYALEWTIGTVLRDGDTLLAMYCAEEEVATVKAGDQNMLSSVGSLPVGQGGNAMQETATTIFKQTEAARGLPGHGSIPASPLRNHHQLKGSATSSLSRPGSTARNVSRLEQERLNAIEDISATCIRFLRKTKLQVRIAVEVIHCKSPKHMITEAVCIGSSIHFPRLMRPRLMNSTRSWLY